MISAILLTTVLSTNTTPLYHIHNDKRECTQEYILNYTHTKSRKDVNNNKKEK